jgi:melanoma-associated antigen
VERASEEEENEDVEDLETLEDAQPGARQSQHEESELEDEHYGEDAGDQPDGISNIQPMVQKLIRFALACEYARSPIRRADIVQKILGPRSRHFRSVFDEAQVQLRDVFGMEMTLYPLKEKVTIRERLNAQKAEKLRTASNAWVLSSILPTKYKTPTIIPPSRVPTSSVESAYVGLYTFVISVITLSGGKLPEAKLERYLSRVHANQTTPIDTTEKLLQRMIKDGYIAKIKESQSGEELVDYIVGQRGSVEVGPSQVAGLVTTVYGADADEELENRVKRSLQFSQVGSKTSSGASQPAVGADEGTSSRKKRRRAHEGTGNGEEGGQDEEWL